MKKNYQAIVNHYEQCFDKYGATPKGMDWPNNKDLEMRFNVLLDVVRSYQERVEILDLGCGCGLLYRYIKAQGAFEKVAYTGLDISSKMTKAASQSAPDASFITQDILVTPLLPKSYDYIVMNGVLTEKQVLSQAEMTAYAKQLISAAFAACRKGIAFNVMSTHVDWIRDDLFHWSMDELAAFLREECGSHYVMRSDYGLYEYMVYVYKEAVAT